MTTESTFPRSESTHGVRRFDLTVTAGWNAFRQSFEAAVPVVEPSALRRLIADHADAAAIREWGAGAAPHGFLVLWQDDNVLLELFHHSQRCITYTIGNLVLAEMMYLLDPSVLLYVPFRLALHEAADGVVVLSFDQPSTALASLEKPGITAVGHTLDSTLADLLEHLGITPPDALTSP